MKFIHLADLHIGKKIANYSLLEDQKYIFEKIINEAREIKPDAFLICGDVFDRTVPGEEAVKLYESFVTRTAEIAPVFIIAGNHDSGGRLSLFSKALESSNIYIEGSYSGNLKKIPLELENERVNIYLLPFFTPVEIRLLTEEPVKSYKEALEVILSRETFNPEEINILLSHQFFSNRGDPELEIGNLEALPAELLEDFDYVALGHLHNQHAVGSEKIRYSGTPLKFTLNDTEKVLTSVSLSKESLEIENRALKPLRDVYQIEDTFNNLIERKEETKDYVVIDMLDKKAIPNAKAALLSKFPNLVQIRYHLENTDFEETITPQERLKQSPIELLEDFFESNHRSLSTAQIALAELIFEEAKKEIEE